MNKKIYKQYLSLRRESVYVRGLMAKNEDFYVRQLLYSRLMMIKEILEWHLLSHTSICTKADTQDWHVMLAKDKYENGQWIYRHSKMKHSLRVSHNAKVQYVWKSGKR